MMTMTITTMIALAIVFLPLSFRWSWHNNPPNHQAVWRVLELWYFDVQLLGGLVLHGERLAEMKTGP